MERARIEAERRVRGLNLEMGMAHRHGEAVGNNIGPMDIEFILRESNLQAIGGRRGIEERDMWQEGGETRYQEIARDQNSVSRRRGENRGLGGAIFSSMGSSSQEAEEENRGGGGGKKTLSERQETEEQRLERHRANEQRKYLERVKRKQETMNGNDPIKKEKLEQKRIQRNKQQKQKYHEKKEREENRRW
ncbi:uncharacterized protein EAF02_009871 [Botrytis sinoallii]|uniref:uncharacterized protein n=1 Tax=Botrytis sinoallii TaxID=1463999 RepID=UPI0019022C0D|nr:uncharacterized protein EAF02_009871 [Botrytis sinoallii]KAF7867085.1 hypothetical protein EAF02_009871 [Botrytis sinoallii]